MAPKLKRLDHLVLTVTDLKATLAFYTHVLGMQADPFAMTETGPRWALHFGKQKINLHERGKEFEPKADTPTPGSADLCFLTETSLKDWEKHLKKRLISVEDGPVARTGATGPVMSLYIRDPDGNLIEISHPVV